MEFALPAALKNELKIYDPALRRAAQLEQQLKREQQPRKATSPLGKVTGLIPESIVSADEQAKAVAHINSQPVQRRYYLFARPIQDADYPLNASAARTHMSGDNKQPGELEVFAIIYHFESRWIAAWLCPKDDPALYGVSYTFRDNESTREKLQAFVFHAKSNRYALHFDESDPAVTMHSQTLGRTNYITHTAHITPEMIRDGCDTCLWNAPGFYFYKKKCGIIAKQAITPFQAALTTRIPTWSYSGIFDRIKANPAKRWLVENAYSYFSTDNAAKAAGIDLATWQLNADSVLDCFLLPQSSIDHRTLAEDTRRATVCRKLRTPRLKTWIQQLCDQYLIQFHDTGNLDRDGLETYFCRIRRLFNQVLDIVTIWGDIALDDIQSNLQIFLQCRRTLERASDDTRAWLGRHMPLKSYLHLLAVHHDKQQQEYGQASEDRRRWHYMDPGTGMPCFQFQELRDVIEMLNIIHGAGESIDPPKRWRISEFHEHVQVKAWTISNPNIDLPQDLFPEPIKVDISGHTLTLFQPINTHQLGQWGEAVRNCVGRASSYAESAKAKKSFLVLGLLDGRPTFTIQLAAENGVLAVRQVVAYANQRLGDEQQEWIAQAFRQALVIRDQQLLGGSVIHQV